MTRILSLYQKITRNSSVLYISADYVISKVNSNIWFLVSDVPLLIIILVSLIISPKSLRNSYSVPIIKSQITINPNSLLSYKCRKKMIRMMLSKSRKLLKD
jgi:hypothetical protein